jgi:hypothetical protein
MNSVETQQMFFLKTLQIEADVQGAFVEFRHLIGDDILRECFFKSFAYIWYLFARLTSSFFASNLY